MNLVLDAASGKELFKFRGEGPVFTSDGGHLLAVGAYVDPPQIGKWDLATGKPVGQWLLPEEARGICASPDGKTAAFFLDGAAVLYDLERKGEVRRWPAAEMRSLRFSPDGKQLAGWGMRRARLWELPAGKEVLAWDQLIDSEVIFSADGKRLAWTGYDARSIPYPWVLDIGQAKPRRLGLPINNLSSLLAFAPDAGTLAVCTDARALELRDAGTGEDALPLDANNGRVFRVELSPDGRYLMTFEHFRMLVWDRATAKVLARYVLEQFAEGRETALAGTVAAGKVVVRRPPDN